MEKSLYNGEAMIDLMMTAIFQELGTIQPSSY